jgi:hypothetical protein
MENKVVAPMFMKEFADSFYDPKKTDPTVFVINYSVTIDMGDYRRQVKWNNKTGEITTIDTAKRGKCIAAAQGLKP